MKFYKRKSIDNSNPRNRAWAVRADGLIETDTTRGLTVPKGPTGDRPDTFVDGQLRYNTTIEEFEVYNSQGDGLGWERVRTVRPGKLTAQTVGTGNYSLTTFGPLEYSDGTPYNGSLSAPQNVMVFIENVYQIPVTNYTLTGSANNIFIQFTSAPPNKIVTALLGIDGYWPP